MKGLTVITNQHDILGQIYLLQKIPYVNITPETMLAKCLLGEYGMMQFIEDDNPVGIVIYRDLFPILSIIGICLKKKTKEFYDLFYDYLREKGYKELMAISKLPEEKFIGFSGFEKEYTSYKKDLTKEN